MSHYENPNTSILAKIDFKGKPTYEWIKEQRPRAYFVHSYATIEQIQPLFSHAEHYAIIDHDRDVYTTGDKAGERKARHCHFIIRYKNSVSIHEFCKKLCELAPDEAGLVDILGDKYYAIDYMLHRDPASVKACKTLYKATDILCDNPNYWRVEGKDIYKDIKNAQFMADLLDDPKSYREMATKYGRDYMKNYHAYDNFRKEVTRQEYVAQLPESDINALEANEVDIAGVCWQIIQKYIPRIKAGCNAPSYDLIKYEVGKILTE